MAEVINRSRTGTRVEGSAGDAASVGHLARQVLAACHDGVAEAGVGALVSVPSERDLAARLGVTHHAVRNALAYLQEQGVLCRLKPRGPLLVAGTVPSSRTETPAELECINLVFGCQADYARHQWQRNEYLGGYTEVLEHHTCKTRYVTWKPERPNFDDLLWCHASPQKQGCLLVSQRDPALLQWLVEHRISFVVQNHCLYDFYPLPPHHKTYVNKIEAAFAATQHLLKLGHRRIGFLGAMPGPQRPCPEFEGYRSALHCAGIPPHPDDLMDLVVEDEPPLGPCRQFLDRPERPTAVLCGFGTATLSLLETARAMGLSLPHDLSLIGFDDVQTPAHPELSTIAVPRHALARQAMELLLEAARQPELPPQTRVMECQVNYRETVGPAG